MYVSLFLSFPFLLPSSSSASPPDPHIASHAHTQERSLTLSLPLQVLFFEDNDVINSFQEKFATYADRFPVWAAHSGGALQIAVWNALEAEGLGANLQHYNPLIDAKVADQWKVPQSWKLSAQLVFGGRTGGPGDKAFQPVEEKFKSFGA